MSNLQEQQAIQSLPAVGQAVGGPVGASIATIAAEALSLFGGKTHLTPSGATYHQATATFKSNQLVVQSLIAQYAAANGLPPPDFPPPPVDGDSVPYYQWMSSWVAYYLNDPSLIANSAKAYDQLKSGGAFNSAIKMQNALIAQLASGAAPPAQLTGGSVAGATLAGSSDFGTLLLYGAGAILLFKVLGD